MEKIITPLTIVFYVLMLGYNAIKYRNELHKFQQNSYRNERYFKWLKHGNFWSGDRIVMFAVVFFVLAADFIGISLSLIFSLACASYVFISVKLLKFKAKVPLKFTSRAKRLYFTSLAIVLIISFLLGYFVNPKFFLVSLPFGSFMSFIILPFANILLKPVENHINNWYINDAKRILAEHPDLLIVGITGSYGKTSTKHFLHTILSQKYNVLMTPGSFNTTMGVVRTIREYLNPTHQVFICEMGAKQINDIKEICDIVHPKIGILTSVAEQHLDTFHNIENVRKTKFELIDSLPEDGMAILNGDYEIIKNTPKSKTTQYYSTSDDSNDFSVKNITYSQHGTTFDLYHFKDKVETFSTELLGEYNISNIVACIVCAYKLGLTTDSILYGVHKLQAVEHRMEIKPGPNGVVIIDDAFNSNPKGAKMALDILSQFTNCKRIVITPGIIELADRQDYYNGELGKQIAKSADFAVLVGKEQTEAIYNGLKAENYPEEQIYIAQGLADAANFAYSRAHAGDVILFENDLPDYH